MSVSDTIQIISIICTSILSIIAIIISVLTLIQNNKMLEESSKPDISIFKHVITISKPYNYFVIKNFGQTGAQIIDIKCNVDLDKYLPRNPFKYLVGTYIAPNQSFTCAFDLDKFECKILNFEIKYFNPNTKSNKYYTSKITIDLNQDHGNLYTKVTTKNEELSTISRTLQEYLVQRL